MEDSTPSRGRKAQGAAARQRLIDASIAQLADAGMRGLTHRKVEQRAGLAQGSAKHYFGTLDALIEAVLTHTVDLDLPLVLQVSPDELANPTPAVLARLMTQAQAAVDAVAARPDLVKARFELYLHAATNPELQHIVAAGRDQFVARIAASLPGANAEAGARFVCALLDGLFLDQLSAPHPTVTDQAASFVLAAGGAGAVLAQG